MRDGPCLWVEEASYEWRPDPNKPCQLEGPTSCRSRALVAGMSYHPGLREGVFL